MVELAGQPQLIPSPTPNTTPGACAWTLQGGNAAALRQQLEDSVGGVGPKCGRALGSSSGLSTNSNNNNNNKSKNKSKSKSKSKRC